MNTINAQCPATTENPQNERRPRGKIGRLPRAVRDQLNQMIDDGVPYQDIKTDLGEHGLSLTVDNISEWKTNGGYKDWLHEQAWHDEIRAQLESFTGLATDPGSDPTQLPAAGLQMSLLQLCRQLRELGSVTRTDQFATDPAQYLRMLNTLSRLTKSLLSLQQYRDQAAAQAARELKHADPKRDFASTEREALLDRADDLFGFKSASRLRRDLHLDHKAPEPSSQPLSSTSSPTLSPTFSSSQPLSGPLSEPLSGPLSEPLSNPHPVPVPPLKSQISNLGSNSNSAPEPEPQQPTPTPAPAAFDSVQNQNTKTESPAPTPIETPNSKIQNPDEHCLQCGAPLPPLKSNGARPSNRCDTCAIQLPPPGCCFLPSIEQCPSCHANLPRLLPDGTRPDNWCHRCGTSLPNPKPAPP